MAHQYFNEGVAGETFVTGACISLTGDEAVHAVKVSRLRVGEEIRVSNGKGFWGFGEVKTASQDLVEIRLQKTGFDAPNHPKLVLIQALAKSGRDERAVEQTTEFGIDEIIAWEADRSIVRWSTEKRSKNILKWRRIAREAAKQSLRSYIPVCNSMLKSTDLVELCKNETNLVLVLDPSADEKLSAVLKRNLDRKSSSLENIFFIVGPEGGISNKEISMLVESGAEMVLVGNQVLRTSSAGAASLAITQTVLNKW
ncbi:MAG TPA: 16S rRNA (uracil(1498)-N(3))-methyltransferase [Microbacteriaceae bacterium]|nr:16S rRNA (uracil(1498)-N(3))-methyltransferase [Microbacteriaceae bacterium]